KANENSEQPTQFEMHMGEGKAIRAHVGKPPSIVSSRIASILHQFENPNMDPDKFTRLKKHLTGMDDRKEQIDSEAIKLIYSAKPVEPTISIGHRIVKVQQG